MYICMSLANSKLFDFVELSRKDQPCIWTSILFTNYSHPAQTIKKFPLLQRGETSVFSRYRMRISPTSSSLVSPVTTVSLPHDDMSLPI